MLTALLFAAPIVVGGPDYEKAMEAVRRYREDPAAAAYRQGDFDSALGDPGRMMGQCLAKAGRVPGTVRVVAAFRDGRLDAVYLDHADPYGACIAEQVAKAAFKTPPHPDYAAELVMHY